MLIRRSESLYRLAYKHRDVKLKELCRKQIMAALTPDNFFAELGHSFTSIFPSFLEEYKSYALKNWVRPFGLGISCVAKYATVCYLGYLRFRRIHSEADSG